MTWFQLVEAQQDDPEARPAGRLVPNSALFLNPALALRPATETEPRPRRRHLRLVKGSRVDPAGAPSAD